MIVHIVSHLYNFTNSDTEKLEYLGPIQSTDDRITSSSPLNAETLQDYSD